MLSIMLTCRQVRDEASATFFRHNHFVFYQVGKGSLPRDLTLDNHWFTKKPVPIRNMTLGSNWETPKLVAKCPNLKALTFHGDVWDSCLQVALEQGRESWILQYRTNLAKLLSRRGGLIRFQENLSLLNHVDIVGGGDNVDTWEVLELIEELKERCESIAVDIGIANSEEEEIEVGPWVVRIEYSIGGVVTARLIRRFEDAITSL